MARGTALSTMVAQLRKEIGESSSTSFGQNRKEALEEILARTQETLYEDFDWPHMTIEVEDSLDEQTVNGGTGEGQGKYIYPATINQDRVMRTWCKEMSGTDIIRIWEIEYAPEKWPWVLDEFNAANAEYDDNVCYWRHYQAGISGSEAYEVWPQPSSDTIKIVFEALAPLSAFASDSDTADLDDRLIVLTAAAEILEQQKNPRARIVQVKAAARYNRLRGSQRRGRKMFQIGTKPAHIREGLPYARWGKRSV